MIFCPTGRNPHQIGVALALGSGSRWRMEGSGGRFLGWGFGRSRIWALLKLGWGCVFRLDCRCSFRIVGQSRNGGSLSGIFLQERIFLLLILCHILGLLLIRFCCFFFFQTLFPREGLSFLCDRDGWLLLFSIFFQRASYQSSGQGKGHEPQQAMGKICILFHRCIRSSLFKISILFLSWPCYHTMGFLARR